MENIALESSLLLFALILMIGEYILVLLSVTADLFSGLRKARKRGEARRSKALRLTIDKLSRYYNALFALTVIDIMQIAAVEYLRIACGFSIPLFPLFTLIGSIGIAIIEVKSIFEKAEDKERADAEYAARTLLKCLKRLNDTNLTEIINELKKPVKP